LQFIFESTTIQSQNVKHVSFRIVL
jgi:hypothetical protein